MQAQRSGPGRVDWTCICPAIPVLRHDPILLSSHIHAGVLLLLQFFPYTPDMERCIQKWKASGRKVDDFCLHPMVHPTGILRLLNQF